MLFQNVTQSAQKYFPDLQIKYKNQSTFMKILGTLLFFNKMFMTSYATTIINTIYFPSETYVKVRKISATVILLHEIIHMHDAKKISKLLFNLLYMFPQIFIILSIPLLLISWKLSLLFLIFILPIPAYFRMYFEKRAYLSSLYVINALGKKLNFVPELPIHSEYFLSQFKGPYYYFMWPFSKTLIQEFSQSLEKVNAGQRPFEDPIFDMLDDLINNA